MVFSFIFIWDYVPWQWCKHRLIYRTNSMSSEINVNNYHSIVTAKPILTAQDPRTREELALRYEQIVASPNTRTLWYNGFPYSTSYQFVPVDEDGNVAENVSGDVFGNVLTHSISSKNGVAMGNSINITDNNELAIGQYNITSAPDISYAFCIGNGMSTDELSNAMTVETDGTVVAYQIAKTKLDTSYVSTLGEKATMGIVMEALLTAANYYKPTFSVSSNKGTGDIARNCIVGHSFSDFTISAGWSAGTKPKYHYTYISSYVNEHGTLPSGVTLQMLGYTSCLMDAALTADNYTADVSCPITVYTSETNTATVNVTSPKQNVEDSENKLVAIYNGTNNFSFNIGDSTNYTIKGFTLSKPGVKTIVNNNITFGYDTPQPAFFKQLADKGVYVESVSNAFKQGTASVNLTVNVYAGYTFMWGVVGSNTNYTQNSPDLQKLITDAMNDTANTNIVGKIVKNTLVTSQYGTGYLPTSNRKVYFGKSKMGTDEFTAGMFKYFFFAFAQGYINATTASSGHYVRQVATKGMGEQDFGDESVFENYNWVNTTYTNADGVNYKIYVARSLASTLYFADETDGGTNVFIQVNQTGLT